jgi:hypothetical protein
MGLSEASADFENKTLEEIKNINLEDYDKKVRAVVESYI